ncbi:MAG TPA: hypothetical protein VGM69_08480 [Chloroflexota bacterium]
MDRGLAAVAAVAPARLAGGIGTPVQWVAPTPLWAGADGERMQRPALLRFASDSFMDDLAGLLQSRPDQVATLLARPESFRARPVGAPADWRPTPSELKLYQPAHGHFYLVAASLVCRLTGLPDRVVDPGDGERVGFVLRRLGRPGQEMAWVTDPAAGKSWQPVTPGRERSLLAFEELLPLFPIGYPEPTTRRRRRLLVGLVPTSSRESFQAGRSLSLLVEELDPATGKPLDPRMDEVNGRVIGPFAALKAPTSTAFGQPSQSARDAIEAQEQEASRFLLLDLAEILATALPALWRSLREGTGVAGTDPGAALHRTLTGTRVDPQASGSPTWAAALKTAWDERAGITGQTAGPPSTLRWNLRRTPLEPDTLAAELRRALGPFVPGTSPTPPAPPPATGQVPKLDPRPGTRYVLRCVYQRPACGPLQPDVVSGPTDPFALAAFFDPDAPGRPIRISLPIDTSIAGLRGFNKNVAFLFSDQLRSQMSRATDLKKALDGNLASGESFDIGLICSFSIPIITICALIVLMIFIILFNFVFWWLPFLRICLPLGLRARQG